jgi:hypothetical protein
MENNSRRAFLKSVILGVGAIALAPVVQLKNAFGGELAKPTDPLVKALGYVPDVGALKGAAAPKDHKKGTKCANCQAQAGAVLILKDQELRFSD